MTEQSNSTMKTPVWGHYLSYYRESIRVMPLLLVAAIRPGVYPIPDGVALPLPL
jgi:hypothetical protein